MHDHHSFNKLSIIVPVFNEEGNLRRLHEELVSVVEALGIDYELLFVDDGSTDGSYKVLRELALSNPHTIVVKLTRNFGQTLAMQAGVDHSSGDVIVFIDADLQNDPRDIPRLLEKLKEGYDIVSGWRKRRKDKLLTRRLPSLIANWLVSMMSGIHLHDHGCTLKAYRRNAITSLRLYGEMHRMLLAYLGQLKFRVTEIEVNHRPRTWGRSKYGLERTLKVFLDLLAVKMLYKLLTKPLYAIGIWGLTTTLFGVLTACGSFICYALEASTIASPLLCISAIAIVGGIQLLMLGLIAEVLMRTYYQTQGIKPYDVKEVIHAGAQTKGSDEASLSTTQAMRLH
ncbi:MAG: glycosyltransferase family 2 protein [Armatimonadota bacterium]|nr:glycosyltransferase family 2 protein [Armatimonadota bacterium]MCX7776455.1 glycosyltransferase family 2 protein [Armatimonadota bacterium]MDW8024253.1 glycosyltransferase family 2 protein [Armatimonadota bacterium]